MEHNFSSWVYHQWVNNCEEREAYGDKHLLYNEYCNKNQKFLHDEYIKDRELNAESKHKR